MSLEEVVQMLRLSIQPSATLDRFLFYGHTEGTDLAWLGEITESKKKRSELRFQKQNDMAVLSVLCAGWLSVKVALNVY
jgi:hypothetical protein